MTLTSTNETRGNTGRDQLIFHPDLSDTLSNANVPSAFSYIASIFLGGEIKELHAGSWNPVASNFPIMRNALAGIGTSFITPHISSHFPQQHPFGHLAALGFDSPEKVISSYLLVVYCMRCNPMLSDDLLSTSLNFDGYFSCWALSSFRADLQTQVTL